MLGSEIAKSGFQQEDIFVETFNENKSLSNKILDILEMSDSSIATKISGKKHDVQIADIDNKLTSNVQIKKYKGGGFNQVDKRWNFEWHPILSSNAIQQLTFFTGEAYWPNKLRVSTLNLNDEFKNEFIQKQKDIVRSAMFKLGIVDYFFCFNELDMLTVFKAVDLYNLILSEPASFPENRTTITLGKHMTMQRKGGDSGERTATMAQVKLKTGKAVKELIDLNLAQQFDFKDFICG